ncbi:unknown [Halorubrum sp. DM2]|uniref:DoxX family protein n=1 Tax=Halorubrum sp. DM2 TaxID=2527867 RepID=UPI0024B7EF79|nr:DoxX family protein [Halorubrum sp. DM2]VTT87736.1 unknown [Halorubrum sp. DM2]
MSYQTSSPLVGETEFALDGPWATYWIAFLRVVTGWWFFHSGFTKILTDGFSYSYGPMYMSEMTGTALGPIPVWMGNNLAFLIEPGVPLFETLIGLALIAGAFTRFAAFGGVIFMSLFWIGNAEFGHGVVNSDLMGLLLFLTVIVLAAGRYYGLDALIEETALVKQNPKLRYLLG